MAGIRVFDRFNVRVWFVDDDGTGLRELEDPIAHLPGDIDWVKTAATCKPIRDEGLEFEFVYKE